MNCSHALLKKLIVCEAFSTLPVVEASVVDANVSLDEVASAPGMK